MTTEHYKRQALQLLERLNGRATLAQIRHAQILPGPLIQQTMAALITDAQVLLQGDSTYVLPVLKLRHGHLKTRRPGEPKECKRCKKMKPAEQYKKRDGMDREPRVCADCMDLTDSSRDTSPDEASGLEHPPGDVDAARENFAIALTVSPRIAGYLEQLRDSGLWGDSLEDVVHRLVCRSLIVQLSTGTLAVKTPVEVPT